HHSAGSMLLSNAKDFLCHVGEIGICQHQSAQRISEARVETGGDDDEIWREPSLDFMDGIGECLPVLASRRPRTQRNIQSKTFSFAASSLARRASPGIIGVLVSRKIENCRVVPEDFLRAIPVMDVPVDDQVFAMAPRNVFTACRLRSNPSKLSRKRIILPECVQNGREPPRIFRMKTRVVFQICWVVN